MRPEELAPLIKELRRGPIHRDEATPVSFGPSELARLLPHRPPFLLVDLIDSVSLSRRTIRGSRMIHPDDPILAGHFPGSPVYPGVLQVEAMGQLGLCLLHFISTGKAVVSSDARPPTVRVTRIEHAVFLEPVLPGIQAILQAAFLEEDSLTATAAGQLYQGGRLCSACILEVYFAED